MFDWIKIAYIYRMEKKESIIIKISGTRGKLELTPDLYDINDLKKVLEDVEDLLFPEGKKGRPLISYELEEGSVIHKFKTSRQAVVGFGAVLLNDCKNRRMNGITPSKSPPLSLNRTARL